MEARARPAVWFPRLALAAGILAILLCYVVALRVPAAGLYHDDGIYLVTAKALAEGKSYRIVSLPVEIPQTKYPVLFPFALSILWRIAPQFPENLPFLKLVPFAASLAWLALVFALIRRETKSPPLAAGIALLTVASPHVLFLSTTLLSETLFAAFAWGGLLLLRRVEDSEPANLTIVGAAVVSAAAFHTRTMGVALIAAGFFGLVLHRRWKTAVLYGSLCALLVAPWFLWVFAHESAPDLYGYYTHMNYTSWSVLSDFPWGQRLMIVAYNGFQVLVVPGMLLTFGLSFLWPVFLGLGLASVAGFIASARRGIGVIHLFVLFTLASAILWAWPPARFLAPILPLLLWFTTQGIALLGTTIPAGSVRRGGVIVAAIAALALLQGWGLWRVALQAIRHDTVCYAPICEDQDWENYRTTMSWIEGNTAPTATLIGNLDPMLYLFTGRKSIRAFDAEPFSLHYSFEPGREPLGQPEILKERIFRTQADYLVATPSGWFTEEPFLRAQIAGLRRARGGLLETAFDLIGTGHRVYRVNRSRAVLPSGHHHVSERQPVPEAHDSIEKIARQGDREDVDPKNDIPQHRNVPH